MSSKVLYLKSTISYDKTFPKFEIRQKTHPSHHSNKKGKKYTYLKKTKI